MNNLKWNFILKNCFNPQTECQNQAIKQLHKAFESWCFNILVKLKRNGK